MHAGTERQQAVTPQVHVKEARGALAHCLCAGQVLADDTKKVQVMTFFFFVSVLIQHVFQTH